MRAAALRRGLQRPDRLAALLERGVVGTGAEGTAVAAAADEYARAHPKIKLTVNGKPVTVPEGSSILTACQAAGAYVSTAATVASGFARFAAPKFLVYMAIEGGKLSLLSCTTRSVSIASVPQPRHHRQPTLLALVLPGAHAVHTPAAAHNTRHLPHLHGGHWAWPPAGGCCRQLQAMQTQKLLAHCSSFPEPLRRLLTPFCMACFYQAQPWQ